VWSQLPVRRQIKTVDPARCVCVEIDGADDRPFLVYGTVLPWLSDDSQAPIPQGGPSFVSALEDQADDWRRLLRDHPDADLCIAGDFNQDLNDEHTYGSRIGKQRLREILAELSLTCVTSDPNDPVKRATGNARGNIDQIVVSSRLAASVHVSEAWAPLGPTGARLSDHHGVATRFG
jgi:hypothetical protein